MSYTTNTEHKRSDNEATRKREQSARARKDTKATAARHPNAHQARRRKRGPKAAAVASGFWLAGEGSCFYGGLEAAFLSAPGAGSAARRPLPSPPVSG